MGSVKDLDVLKKPDINSEGEGRFIFSDRYSVFDWGEMPDHIENKGASLCILSSYFFNLLEKNNIKTHFIGLVENEKIKKYEEISEPTNIMQVKMVRVIKPVYNKERNIYDYSAYKDETKNYLIPLEIIYRNKLTEGSSVFKRLKSGSITYKDLGLDHEPKIGEVLNPPLLDVSTKLEHFDKYLSWEEAKHISNLTDKKLNQLKNLILKINKIITESEKQRKEIENKIREISEAKGKKSELERSLEDIRKEIALLEEKLKEKPDENLIRSLEEELKNIERTRKELEEKISRLIQEIGELNGKIKEKENILEKIKEYKFEKEKLEKDLENKNKRLEILNVLYNDIFNERGFPLSLLDDYLSDLNQIANSEYLVPLLKNKRIEIKRVGDKIEINVFDDIYERDLSTYSGGEKTAIGFALRLAIVKTLTLRRGISPKFLIIDEGFGPLSLEIRDLILRLILNLKDEYEKIFIVSHLEDIQENPMFDSVIRIYKDENNISHIEKIK